MTSVLFDMDVCCMTFIEDPVSVWNFTELCQFIALIFTYDIIILITTQMNNTLCLSGGSPVAYTQSLLVLYTFHCFSNSWTLFFF